MGKGRPLTTYIRLMTKRSAAFHRLDKEIGKSEILMSVAPLRCITIGGSLAVMLCGNRKSTLDVDILLDPNVRHAEDYWSEFRAAIERTAASIGIEKKWMNEDVRTFVAREKMEDLFFRSIDANILIYNGSNLLIYAGDLFWALERKLRRVSHAEDRKKSGKDVDLPDAVALIHMIKGWKGNAPLNLQQVQQYNLNTFDVAPDTESLKMVAHQYYKTYGEDGLVEYVWDKTANAWKWQGQDGNWRSA